MLVLTYTGIFAAILFGIYNDMLEFPLATGGELLVIMYVIAIAGTVTMMDGFKIGYLSRANIILSQIIACLIVDFVFYLIISLSNRAFASVWPMLLHLLISIAVAIFWTYLSSSVMRIVSPPKKMVLVYSEPRFSGSTFAAGRDEASHRKIENFIKKMVAEDRRFVICRAIRYEEEAFLKKSSADDLSAQLEEGIKKGELECVLIYLVPSQARNDIMKICYEKCIDVYIYPRISDIFIRSAVNLHQLDVPLIVCHNGKLKTSSRIIKRAFDIVASLLALIILSPIMALTALAIKIENPKQKVIFEQDRITEDERVFKIKKFRSMDESKKEANDEESVRPAVNDDARITRVGAIIRRLRIDELPQLINILKGDMSIVGPRPEKKAHHEAYCAECPEFRYRTKMKAGLTGYAQIMGKYNTTPYDKLLLDLMYITNYSFFMDIKIILQTVKIIFMKESTEAFENVAGPEKKEGES